MLAASKVSCNCNEEITRKSFFCNFANLEKDQKIEGGFQQLTMDLHTSILIEIDRKIRINSEQSDDEG